jgi:serine/threonine protein kinase
MALRDDFHEHKTQEITPPKLIGGRYRLDQRIGGGESADTYRAYDVVLNRPVALKLLRTEFASDRTSFARFAREARAAAAVNHPNVVQVYDYGVHEGQAFLVMTYVAGRNLKQVVEAEGQLSPAYAVRLLRRVLRGLGAIHAAGIVHRDIKPQNILVGNDGQVRVADFGIARGPADATLTSHGTAIGTVAYMAPEQIRGEPVSAATDLYAVGAVLFESLTGRPPFQAEHPVAIMHAHLQTPPPNPSQLRSGISTALAAIVQRALAKDPVDRFQSAPEMIQALDAAIPLSSANNGRDGKFRQVSAWIGPLAVVLVALTFVGGAVAMVLDDDPREQATSETRTPEELATDQAALGAVVSTPNPTATATARVVRAPAQIELQLTATEPKLPATATEPVPTEPQPTATTPPPTATTPPTSIPTSPPDDLTTPAIVPVNGGAATQEEEVAVPVTLQFNAADWQGGYFRGDAEWYGRAWTAIYGAQSSHPAAAITFSLDAAPAEPATLSITGLDDEWAGSNPIVISVNGVEIFAGPSPFQSWDGAGQGEQAAWTAVEFEVPAGSLQAGTNEITIANQAQSASFGTPPYILVSDAFLEITN